MVHLPELAAPLRIIWHLFDVGREQNLATWYASMLWTLLGALAILGTVLTRRRWSWAALAFVAFLAAIDEFAELHERLDVFGNVLRDLFEIDIWFSWVLAAIPIVIVVAALLTPLLLAMPRGQGLLLILGGVMFLVGALVLETVSGKVLQAAVGNYEHSYIWITAFEELLELIGVSVAIGAVAGLYDWSRTDGKLEVRFRGWHAERSTMPS